MKRNILMYSGLGILNIIVIILLIIFKKDLFILIFPISALIACFILIFIEVNSK